MTDEELIAHLDLKMKSYKGDAETIRNAVGAVMLGRIYGWRVLRLITSSGAYTKYQRVLELDFKEVLQEETPLSERSLGYVIVKKLKNFWKVVRGQEPLKADVKNSLGDVENDIAIDYK